MRDDDREITAWLEQVDAGGPETTNELFALLYRELRRAAAAQLRREPDGHTLGVTALAHEAWLRLAEQTRTRWRNRSHFLGVASIMMRRILVNHAQARRAAKRDAVLVPLTWSEAGMPGDVAADASGDVLRVHEALLAFEAVDARAARVVELRFFGGLEVEEVAAVMAISTATVKRDWAFARAWLQRALG
jgi:RNA polymerase sigma factor (TIGR02999 family)